MSFTREYFTIDGINSVDIDVDECILVRTSAEINRKIMGDKEIIEETIPYNDLPIPYRTSKGKIEFDLMLSFLDKEITTEKIQNIGYIFAKDKYVSFQHVDYLNVQFFIISTSIELVTYGTYRGMLKIHLETNSPYAWCYPSQVSTFDLSATPLPITITVNNNSNVTDAIGQNYFYPEVYIDLKSTSTGITLTNLSDNNRATTLTGLNTSESIVLNRSNLRQIESSTGLPRLSKFNKNFLRLKYGTNYIRVDSPCLLQIKATYPVYT